MLLLLHAEHVDKGACLPYQLFTPFTPYNIQSSPYFDPTHTRTGWIGQPPILNRHEVVTIDGDVVTLRQATPSFERARRGDRGLNSGSQSPSPPLPRYTPLLNTKFPEAAAHSNTSTTAANA